MKSGGSSAGAIADVRECFLRCEAIRVILSQGVLVYFPSSRRWKLDGLPIPIHTHNPEVSTQTHQKESYAWRDRTTPTKKGLGVGLRSSSAPSENAKTNME